MLETDFKRHEANESKYDANYKKKLISINR